MHYEVMPAKLFRQNAGILTYHSTQKLLPGHIVTISLGRHTVVGVVLRSCPPVKFTTKPIQTLLYPRPLPLHLVQAATWLADYYSVPLPNVINLLLPLGITKKRRQRPDNPNPNPTQVTSSFKVPPIPLNSAQKQAYRDIKANPNSTKLLHGITGSGKTNIYLQLTADTLQKNQSTILLVPEIALTSQLVQIFTQNFKHRVVLVHSRQTEAERHLNWQQLLNSSTPQIVIGPRSALLSPLHQLGLIIIDEAHEATYFQENTPKYSALRLASFIAQKRQISSLIGTATPLVTDLYLARQKHSLISLTQKAKNNATPPQISVIDLKDRNHFTKNRYFSDQLLQNIQTNLQQKQQTLIFHNRRGSAPLTLCQNCGWQALCPTCFLPLSLHTDSYQLICHSCGHQSQLPSSCPDCQHASLVHKGFGTKLLASELERLFPAAHIARFDGDNSKTETLDQLYQSVQSGAIDIIIGTQTLARGLDLPKLATVAVVQADQGLSLPDYAAEERSFQLLTQVIGRVGRGHLKHNSAIIQSYQPEHPTIQAAIQQNYPDFAAYLLKKRRAQKLPPFSYLAKLSLTYKTESTTLTKIRQLHQQLSNTPSLTISSPLPAFHEHSSQGYTWQIILRSSSRQKLQKILSSIPPSPHLHFTLDPPSLL